MKPLFPSELINSSKEVQIKKHTTRSKVIYLILLLSFVVLCLSLFFVSIDVNVQCRGIITTPSKQAEIRNTMYGRLIYSKLSENLLVNKGDTLAIVDTLDIDRSIEITKQRLSILVSENKDLKLITSAEEKELTRKKNLKTLKYVQEYHRNIADVEYLKAEIENCKLEYERQSLLFKSKVISQVEYEQSRYRYQNAKLKYQQHYETQLAKWQEAIVNNQNQILVLKESLNNLKKEKGFCFIISPIEGYIQNLQPVKLGSTVFANYEICRISGTDSLIVEMFITPKDIGYVYLSQNVKYRVDAFNANRWGMLTGEVLDISNDINFTEENAIGFRVVGGLNGTELNYDGRIVQVKKGMTLTANIVLTRRTLVQLLFDDISKWLNPNIVNQQ